jgi:hypothetical protein
MDLPDAEHWVDGFCYNLQTGSTVQWAKRAFPISTLQRLPGGLDELEALAEQLPPEDRACTGNWHLLGEARGYAAARTALVTPGRARSGRRLPEAD